jgi:hypothetical protein
MRGQFDTGIRAGLYLRGSKGACSDHKRPLLDRNHNRITRLQVASALNARPHPNAVAASGFDPRDVSDEILGDCQLQHGHFHSNSHDTNSSPFSAALPLSAVQSWAEISLCQLPDIILRGCKIPEFGCATQPQVTCGSWLRSTDQSVFAPIPVVSRIQGEPRRRRIALRLHQPAQVPVSFSPLFKNSQRQWCFYRGSLPAVNSTSANARPFIPIRAVLAVSTLVVEGCGLAMSPEIVSSIGGDA